MFTVYTFEDADGAEASFTTSNPTEALEYARKSHTVAIANEHEFVESYEVNEWDFRPAPDAEDAA